jgi:hypothetical protein
MWKGMTMAKASISTKSFTTTMLRLILTFAWIPTAWTIPMQITVNPVRNIRQSTNAVGSPQNDPMIYTESR